MLENKKLSNPNPLTGVQSRKFLAEKQGFVLAFCKAVRVKYFYALQKSSGSR